MALYYGVCCSNEKCAVRIPLKLIRFDSDGIGQTLKMGAQPIQVRCPQCKQSEIYEPSTVVLFEGPEPAPNFRNHPELQ
jgi:hypothetical protein